MTSATALGRVCNSLNDRKIKIAIIDDHDIFREGVELALSKFGIFDTIFSSDNGNKFLEEVANGVVPDVTLMDINMPIKEGGLVTEEALEINPTLKIIALTSYSDLYNYSKMVRHGVKGFILKKSGRDEIKEAILSVYNGSTVFDEKILSKLKKNSNAFSSFNNITPREKDILSLICLGKSSLEVANILSISKKTVDRHRSSIYEKADVNNIAELIIWAIKEQIITVD